MSTVDALIPLLGSDGWVDDANVGSVPRVPGPTGVRGPIAPADDGVHHPTMTLLWRWPLRCLPRALLLALILSVPAWAQDPTPPAAKPEDVGSPGAILAALYESISGPAGQERDWNRFRSLFAPGARLIPVRVRPDGSATPTMLTPEDYVARSGPMLKQNGFFEREIHRTEDQFGAIMQVFSTYESRRTAADPQPFSRGINSIQLLKDGNRWWVVTIYWDSERQGNPIPAKYLPR
jgi:hypothetical protein